MAVLIEQLEQDMFDTAIDYWSGPAGEDPPLPGTVIQTFTLTGAVTVSSVLFNIGIDVGFDPPMPSHRTLRVRIFQAVAATGETSGLALGTATTNTSTLSWNPPTYQLMEFTFSEGVVLAAGEYAIIVDVTDGSQLWGDYTYTELLPDWWLWVKMASWGPRGHSAEQYSGGEAFVGQATIISPLQGEDDWAFQIMGSTGLTLTPTFPEHEATGIKIAPAGLTWECDGFDAETMGFDIYFRMFGVTQFTQVGDGQSELTLALPDNLVYDFLYFWKVNVRDLATDEILLEGDEWNFNTEALIKYPVPSSRTVPAPGGGTMSVTTAENSLAAIRYLVAAAQNKLFYEYVAGT